MAGGAIKVEGGGRSSLYKVRSAAEGAAGARRRACCCCARARAGAGAAARTSPLSPHALAAGAHHV